MGVAFCKKIEIFFSKNKINHKKCTGDQREGDLRKGYGEPKKGVGDGRDGATGGGEKRPPFHTRPIFMKKSYMNN